MRLRKIEERRASPYQLSKQEEGGQKERRKRKAKPYLILLAVVVSAIMASVFWYIRHQGVITVNGRILAAQVQVTALHRGRITSLPFEEGDAVKKGQVIARLDETEYYADVKDAQAALEVAQTDLKRSSLALEWAKEALERQKELYLLRATTKDELNKAYSEYRRASVDLAASRSKVKRAEAALEAAKGRLDKATIVVPRSGIVGWQPREVGEVVGPNEPILTIIDPTDMWVEAWVPMEQAFGIRNGQKAQITVASRSEKTFDGRIIQLFRNQGALSPNPEDSHRLEGRLFQPIKVVFTDPRQIPDGLRPGMVVRIKIVKLQEAKGHGDLTRIHRERDERR